MHGLASNRKTQPGHALNKTSSQASLHPISLISPQCSSADLSEGLPPSFRAAMYLSLLALAVGVCFLLSAIARPTRAGTASQVYTPFGLRPANSVYHIPDGASIHHVGEDMHLVDTNGTVIHRTRPSGNFTRKPHAADTPALEDGWVAYAYWLNNLAAPINYFDTRWTVPPAPPSSDGQTIFLFNSIEPSTGDAILQPVLQWGGECLNPLKNLWGTSAGTVG
ncbi:hypothetical protein DL93DRAFT_1582427 [Clavulina sp. PMI_390]|nr:hypothetical protein DL93DRAFT_1582427 [Clavulina sp. PMI_390]